VETTERKTTEITETTEEILISVSSVSSVVDFKCAIGTCTHPARMVMKPSSVSGARAIILRRNSDQLS
jgi:hypothetical protein